MLVEDSLAEAVAYQDLEEFRSVAWFQVSVDRQAVVEVNDRSRPAGHG